MTCEFFYELKLIQDVLTQTQVANLLAGSDFRNRKTMYYEILLEHRTDTSQPAGPPDQYLTLTLRRLGFDTFDSNLLSIPAQVLTTINVRIPNTHSPLLSVRS